MRSGIISLIVSVCLTRVAEGQFQEQELQFTPPAPATAFVGSRVSLQLVGQGSFLYVLGGYRWDANHGIFYPKAQVADLKQDGRINTWHETSEMVTPRTGLGAVASNGFVYAVGGSDSNWQSLDSAEYAKILPNGDLGPWKTDPHRLKTARSNLSLLRHESLDGSVSLYAVGGVGQVGSKTVHFDSVEFAPVQADGSLGEWRHASFDMKGGRSTPAAFVEFNRLYICGGWGDRNFDDVFSDVQYTSLSPDADLNPWQTNSSGLWMRMYGQTASVVHTSTGSFAVLIGGTLGEGNIISFIQYGRIHEDGSVGPWIMARTKIDRGRWGHAATIIGSRLYVAGGSSSSTDFLDDVQFLDVTDVPRAKPVNVVPKSGQK